MNESHQENNIVMLRTILEEIKPISQSIIQIGSTVYEKFSQGRDIDLIIITKDGEDAKYVKKVISSHPNKLLIDYKIYTEDEFVQSKGSRDNFFLWCAVQNAKILHGPESWLRVKLVPSQLTRLLWNGIRDIEEACDRLESRVEFTGCCFKVYSSLKTLFFANAYILERKIESKETYLRSILKDEYEIARERYRWAFQHLKDRTTEKMHAPLSIDKRYGNEDYEKMYDASTRALDFAKEKVPELLKAIEIL